MRNVLIIAHLTFLEARRRRIIPAAAVCGLSFLLVYAIAIFFIHRNGLKSAPLPQRQFVLEFLTLAGLYVSNFLTIAVAILLPVDTLSGEIESGIMQTLASKPIRRAEILLGKWLTYWAMSAVYLLLMAGGVVLAMHALTGFAQAHMDRALPLMLLGATVVLTVSTAGGVWLTTITNGMVAFGFYGLAFIGGWVEQIGTLTSNAAARYIGTAISLASPVDAMWRKAAFELQPPIMRDLQLTPFGSASLPSAAMVLWAVGFVAAVLALGLQGFRHRPL